MLSTPKRQVDPYTPPLTESELPPPPLPAKVSAIVKNCKEDKINCNSSKYRNEQRTIDRLRSRLARHLYDICLNKNDVREKLRILKALGENEPLAAWHRREIIGHIEKKYALLAENRLRCLIRQAIIDLTESLGGAA